MVRHQCPVCGVVHEVSAIRAGLAYGRQLSCSCDCEAERLRRRRARYRHLSDTALRRCAPDIATPREPATT